METNTGKSQRETPFLMSDFPSAAGPCLNPPHPVLATRDGPVPVTTTSPAECDKEGNAEVVGVLLVMRLHTGLFEMIVGVLTTCHTKYT